MNEEENLMKATISSLNKINDNLYTINYQNDYYLEEIIDKEIQNYQDIKKFATQKNLGLILILKKYMLKKMTHALLLMFIIKKSKTYLGEISIIHMSLPL